MIYSAIYDVDGKVIIDTARFVRSGMIVWQKKDGKMLKQFKVLVNRCAENCLEEDALDMVPTSADTEMIAGVDQYNGNRIIVYKQECLDWNDATSVVWEWKATAALGREQLVAYKVVGSIEKPELVVEKMYKVSAQMEGEGGHDLYPVYGEDNKLWITVCKEVYQFDTISGTFGTDFSLYNRV